MSDTWISASQNDFTWVQRMFPEWVNLNIHSINDFAYLFFSGLKRPLGVIYLVHISFKKFTKLLRKMKLVSSSSSIYFLTTGIYSWNISGTSAMCYTKCQGTREHFWGSIDIGPNQATSSTGRMALSKFLNILGLTYLICKIGLMPVTLQTKRRHN